MMLPFVSREALTLAVAQATYFRAKAEQWEQRYLEVTVPKPVPVVEKSVDPVSRAIRDAAGSNSALRGHLAHFARGERDKGTPEDEIVAQIRTYEQGPASTKPQRDAANAELAQILDGL